MTQTILLVGATGMLGGRIAHHLAEQSDARLRLLIRDGLHNKKLKSLEPLIARGVEIVAGDLADAESLDKATQGVDVIVSAVQGGPDIIINGQVALAEAGKRNGVRRILPSDFGLDLFKATKGEHPAFNWRAEADEVIAATGIEHIHMLQGGFMEMFGRGSPLVDYDQGIVQFWGKGDEQIEITSVDDTARMTVQVALDPSVTSGKFAFYGDKLSFNEVADIAEKRTGKSFKRISLGDEAQLRSAIAEAKKSDFAQSIMLAYQLYMLNGQTSLEDIQNDRYPNIKLTGFADFLAARMS